MTRTNFIPQALPAETEKELQNLCHQARGNILKMTSLAASGHPGGSMSSLEIFAMLWSQANVNPTEPSMKNRDRILVSHGHTSPAVYSVLGALNFFDLHEAVVSFRLAGSDFEGHIERHIPGIELTSGNLGQGLSAAIGMGIAGRSNGIKNHIWVVAGDGENQKGQISEARRFASKYMLNNLTYIIDLNHLQISGDTADVMPVNLRAEFEASGWDVAEVDGHNLGDLYKTLRPEEQKKPRLVIARTVMGKGVSFMENKAGFHGRALKKDELEKALKELNIKNNIEELAAERKSFLKNRTTSCREEPSYHLMKNAGNSITYGREHKGDNRSAWGKALVSLADANPDNIPLVFDCDLAGSVKTAEFAAKYPGHFFQTGIMEHHTATMAGCSTLADKVSFWSDFGVFAIDETFNQHRLNDINHTNLKVVATHCGLDVGPDGKTHHCIKYVGLLRALPNYRTIVPADPNQTDRAVRHAATSPGNYFIAIGRSKLSTITREDGSVFFDENYEFKYGTADEFRTGTDVAILAMGPTCEKAILSAQILEVGGISTAVWGVSCPTEISEEFIKSLLQFKHIITVEDHDTETGLGAGIALALSEAGNAPPLTRIGVTHYGMSGDAEDLYTMQGLQPEQIVETIIEKLSS
ncbi:MAG: transketolase [Candidatus Sabulitectum sp.]|nr:transketolase [Candidatus Sabulitectum sp.]